MDVSGMVMLNPSHPFHAPKGENCEFRLVKGCIVFLLCLSNGVAIHTRRYWFSDWYAAATFTESNRFPIDIIEFVQCAEEGVGEEVRLYGKIHELFHITSDNAGGVHVKIHSNFQGVSGIGLTSGDKYHGTGVTQEGFNIKSGSEFTFVETFHIIGQGAGNNLVIHDKTHFTVNSDGEVTTFHDNFTFECK